ncbi:response regulator transcription factor [Actinomadura soli]|uniref:Response regulator transcription factor n=1 Tax=Actinomadura soli TaxID=2508997 RepID=A0A5C4JHT1_9ACTN|nr:response regulator transcription factor [Actinomadura soli]
MLVVEDDADVRSALVEELTDRGYSVRATGEAWAALREVADGSPRVVLLDLGLPDMDGRELLKLIRAVSDAAIVVITARDAEEEVVTLLRGGADDYMVKPFRAGELDARIGAVLRRMAGRPIEVMEMGGLRLDLRRHEAWLDGAALGLTPREFELLAYLASRPGEVVSRAELRREVWRQPYGTDQTVDVHLSWLRRKLGETAAAPRFLRTVRGVGVRFDIPS